MQKQIIINWHQSSINDYYSLMSSCHIVLPSCEPRSCQQLTFLFLNYDRFIFANYSVHEPLKRLTTPQQLQNPHASMFPLPIQTCTIYIKCKVCASLFQTFPSFILLTDFQTHFPEVREFLKCARSSERWHSPILLHERTC